MNATTLSLSKQWNKLKTQNPKLRTRQAAVHEKKGTYQNFKLAEQVGLVLDDNIDLRIFFDHWHFGFAAEVDSPLLSFLSVSLPQLLELPSFSGCWLETKT
jgi:putative heme degradation protein